MPSVLTPMVFEHISAHTVARLATVRFVNLLNLVRTRTGPEIQGSGSGPEPPLKVQVRPEPEPEPEPPM